MTRASPFRLAAEGRIRAVLRLAEIHGWSAQRQRARLLEAFRRLVASDRGRLKRPHAVWLRTVRIVTGGVGVMALPDRVSPDQETLSFVVPRRRREEVRSGPA